MSSQVTMETLVSLSKRRGFIFQGSEIYGGIGGMYDYGPLGSLLKNNIKNSWLRKFVHSRDDMFLVDAAILMNQRVWAATGHTTEFIDPLVECSNCQKRCRVDNIVDEKTITTLIERHGSGSTVEEIEQAQHFIGPLMKYILAAEKITCPDCGKVAWGMPRVFNMMLETRVGAATDSSSVSYLRPETAQGIFVNYKNVLDSQSPKLPFGIGQIGKAFRNEITPRDFIFRLRELEQMEIEYFFDPESTELPLHLQKSTTTHTPSPEQYWNDLFDYWIDEQLEWLTSIGIDGAKLHNYEHPAEARSHYSRKTVDWEFEFPFGTKELTGLAYRTDFDLRRHSESSGVNLDYFDEPTKRKVVPHVIEPSMGVDRLFLAVLTSSYREEVLENGEIRVFLQLPPDMAPYKLCVSPLLRNKPELVEKARTLYSQLKSQFLHVTWDDNSNIGKRYRRQDEIGTPFCVTIDFDTLSDDTVTVRDRDTGTQSRVSILELPAWLDDKLSS